MPKIYVQVLHDFYYHTEDGNEIKLQEGEELMLLQKSSENWWQVLRNAEEYPFYAPSNYLCVIGKDCSEMYEQTDINANLSDTSLIYKDINPPLIQYTYNKNCDNYNSNCEVNLVKIEKPNTKRTSKDITPIIDEFSLKNSICNNKTSRSHLSEGIEASNILTIEEKSYSQEDKVCSFLSSEAFSPIYVNIPASPNRIPPLPNIGESPLRCLPNDWFEYFDEESGRKYYFHSISGKVTWKPPRRHESFQSTPLSSKQNSPKLHDSPLTIPKPPPKQLKPKLQKLNHSSTESLDSSSSSSIFTILPSGWSQECDLQKGLVYYTHDAYDKKWFSSLDENGRTYFYEEDSTESVWELPDISSSLVQEGSLNSQVAGSFKLSSENLSQSITNEKPYGNSSLSSSPKLRSTTQSITPRQFKTRSMVVPECVNLLSADDNKGFLPPSFGEGYWPSVQDGHFSITRKGTLNKTKLVEGGKRIKKNWTTSFVVLTDVFLLFYKDVRSAHMTTPSIKPELCIDLNGALIEWSPEKSSRKNVFQISTVLGHQLLLQDDNAQTTKEWFETIQAAIMNLPSSLEQVNEKHLTSDQEDGVKRDIKLARSKSTKQYSCNKTIFEGSNVSIPAEKKSRIRHKLRQFFIRRPTLESLREKGILQDEQVFGCHLQTLCNRENRNVPKFVEKCISVIEKKELTADGLYRASGNLSEVQKIRFHVNQDDYTCLNEEEDVHVLTGALKMFFREMKEPLFPFNTFEKFIEAIAISDVSSKLDVLKELIINLPLPNYETLKFLLEHLLRVTQFHKQNRMQIQNLAIVFGPTLMWPELISNNIALDMMYQNRIIEFLLLEFSAIFNETK